MKIAAITDDGTTISQHFGRAPYYVVVTVEAGAGTGPTSLATPWAASSTRVREERSRAWLRRASPRS